jgi:hypothetical protein
MLAPRQQGDVGELSAIVWLAGQSWNGVIKRLDAKNCDYLFVLVRDGGRWFIPSTHFGGGRGLRLGGPKYAEFEVEQGDPIPGCTAQEGPSTIAS